MKDKSSFGLFIAWLITGIIVLIAGPNRLTYGIVWVLLLINYLAEAFIGDYNTGYKDGFDEGVHIAIEKCKEAIEQLFEERKKAGELTDENPM